MTWGISGHDYLLLYGGLCMTTYLVARAMWLRTLGPEPPDPDPRRLDVYEAAMVGGGVQLAITAAATKLHSDGRLRQGSAGASALVVAGELARDAHPLERDVFEAVRRTPDISTAQLRRELDDSPAIDALLTRLTEEGLVVDAPRDRAYRRLWVACALLAAFGAARLIAVWAGGGHGVSVGYLVALTVAAAMGTIVVLRRDPIATRRGRALVTEQRERHELLRASPSAGDAVLAVALFGGAALWLADPAIASVLEVRREAAQSGGARHDTCGGGGGCGGGCGGGGGCG